MPSDAAQGDDRTQKVERPWLAELDGLRALACLAVVIAHFNPWPLLPSDGSAVSAVRRADAFSLANLGVVFFFTLSSFLLTYLAVREREESGRIDVFRFYARRGFRIWPLYFTALAAGLFLASRSESWEWTRRHAWMFITFLSNWSLAFHQIGGHVDHSTPPLAILWSIAVEEQFYLFFPLVLPLALRSPRMARIIAGSLIVLGVGFRVVFPLLPVRGPIGPGGGLYYATLSYADVFLCGAVAGWLAARGRFGWLQRRGPGWLLLAGLAFAGFVWKRQCWHPYAPYTSVIYGATGALFALVILWTVAHRESWACRFLRWSPMRGLGTLSYGMYLWHPIGAALLLPWITPFTPFGPLPQPAIDTVTLLWFGSYLAITVGLAAVSTALIESPFLRLKERLSRAPARPRPLWTAFATAVVCAVLVWGGAQSIRVICPMEGNRSPAKLSKTLGVRVDLAPGETCQYLVRAPEGSVDFAKVGTVHENLGYSVGVTLSDGTRIGFRYAPLPGP